VEINLLQAASLRQFFFASLEFRVGNLESD